MKILSSFKKFLWIVLLYVPFFSFARGKNELVKNGHWIYDALVAVSMEEGRLDFTDRSPLSVGEILFFLDQVS